MTGWIILAVYLAGYLLAWRPCARFVTDESAMGRVEWIDLLAGALFGSFLALLWPVLAVFHTLRRGFSDSPEAARRALYGESRRAKVERLEREEEERKAYVARLERELGITEPRPPRGDRIPF